MSKKEKVAALTVEAIAKLKSGDILYYERGSIRKQGITIIVTNGEKKRPFDHPLPAFEFASITEEQFKRVVKEREKRVKESLKANKHREKEIAKAKVHEEHIAKKAARKERKRNSKIRKFFDGLIYTLVWLLFLAGGALVFNSDLIQIPSLVEGEPAQSLLAFLSQVASGLPFVGEHISAIVIGVGVLAALILLATTLKLQLHKTKSAKVWGLLTGGISLAGAIYLSVVPNELAAIVEGSKISIAQVAVLGLVLVQLIIVLAVGWKKKAE